MEGFGPAACLSTKVGGGLSLMGDILLRPLRTFVDEHVIGSFQGTCEILPAALGEDVVLVGALLLAPTD